MSDETEEEEAPPPKVPVTEKKAKWVTTTQAGKMLLVSRHTALKWATQGLFGDPHVINGVNKYDPSRVLECQNLARDDTVPLLQEALASALKELGNMARVLSEPQQKFIALQQEEVRELRTFNRKLQEDSWKVQEQMATWHVMIAEMQSTNLERANQEKRRQEAWELLQEQIPRIVEGAGMSKVMRDIPIEHLEALNSDFVPEALRPRVAKVIEQRKATLRRTAEQMPLPDLAAAAADPECGEIARQIYNQVFQARSVSNGASS